MEFCLICGSHRHTKGICIAYLFNYFRFEFMYILKHSILKTMMIDSNAYELIGFLRFTLYLISLILLKRKNQLTEIVSRKHFKEEKKKKNREINKARYLSKSSSH